MASKKVTKTEPAPALNAGSIAAVVASTQAQGYGYLPENEATPLANAGYLEINPDGAKNSNGDIMVRATDKAISEFGPAAAETSPASAAQAFVRRRMALPGLKRGGGGGPRASIFPFDALEAPTKDANGELDVDSFHVPKTAERKDPANSLGSIVTAANRKYATPIAGQFKTRKRTNKETGAVETVSIPEYSYTRKFTLRAVDKTDPDGEGARVFRVQ